MKYAIASLIFFICLPISSSAQSVDSVSATENCSYATQGVHTVSESPYRQLLARLRGDRSSKEDRKRKRDESTGQR